MSGHESMEYILLICILKTIYLYNICVSGKFDLVFTDQRWVLVRYDAISDRGLQGQSLDSCIPKGAKKNKVQNFMVSFLTSLIASHNRYVHIHQNNLLWEEFKSYLIYTGDLI